MAADRLGGDSPAHVVPGWRMPLPDSMQDLWACSADGRRGRATTGGWGWMRLPVRRTVMALTTSGIQIL